MADGALERIPTPGALVDRVRCERRRCTSGGSRSPAPGREPGSAARSPRSTRSRTRNQTILYTPAWGARPRPRRTPPPSCSSRSPPPRINTDLKATVAAIPDGATRDPGRRRRPRRDRHGRGKAPGRGAAGRHGHGPADPPGCVELGRLGARRRPAARQGREARLLDRARTSTRPTSPRGSPARRSGSSPDGRVILVAVDGGRPGSSVGMTTYELAQTMAKLGAVTAAGLQYGKFVTAAFDGQVAEPPEPALGAGARQGGAARSSTRASTRCRPSVPVLGKANVTAGEQLAYRITHPSQVTATLVGPDGQSHQIDSGSKQPGTYQLHLGELRHRGHVALERPGDGRPEPRVDRRARRSCTT